MKSRAARILVPLAVEVAFALIVFIAIRATDGGRYGLGAKAALDDFLNTYERATAYEAAIVDVPGAYRKGWGDWQSSTGVHRFMQFYFQRPDSYAVREHAFGGESLRTQIGHDGTLLLRGSDEAVQTIDVAEPFRGAPSWRPPVVHGLLHDERGVMFTHREGTGLEGLKPMRMGELSGFGLLREATHVDVERRTAPDGKPCFVLTVWQGRPWRELWLDAETHELRACVFMQGDDVHTELYMHTRFDRPIDAAIFEGGEVGFERLKQWMAERESAPTN